MTEYATFTKIRLGSIQFDQIYQELTLSKAPVVYPAYRNTGGGYDIAIMYLSEDIRISKDAFPACLYHGKDPLVTESPATVIGFGQTHGKTYFKFEVCHWSKFSNFVPLYFIELY